jgi:hypothetical protein
LLRVLTDLYVQKLTHTLDEERHYTELALRLIDSVDGTARAAVAAQLGKHLSPPRQVIERLAEDLLEVADVPRSPAPHANARRAATLPDQTFSDQTNEARGGEDRVATVPRAMTVPVPAASAATVARELNEIFFTANAHERRLILLNLDVVISFAAERPRVARDPTVGQRLEAAALARKPGKFVQELAQSLQISGEQARRIVDDELGEPIVIAAKALHIRRDLLYRILLFVNTAVGHSVERVHALAQLYDEITFHVAQDLVAIWQALGNGEPNGGTHLPLPVRDKPDAQFTAAVRRTPLWRRNERREVS